MGTQSKYAKEVADKQLNCYVSILLKVFDGCAWKLRSYHFSAFPWIFTSHQDKEELTGKRPILSFPIRCWGCSRLLWSLLKEQFTVSRGAAIGAKKKQSRQRLKLWAALEGAKAALLNLQMLPVLKEVMLWDSGGQGLVFIYEGFLSALTGEYSASEDFGSDSSQYGWGDQWNTRLT